MLSRGSALHFASGARGSRLVHYLTIAYLLLVAYASLYPFTGWHAPTPEVREFLTASWPHYITWTDIVLNVLAYVPLGLLFCLVLLPRLPRLPAAVLAGIAGTGVSLGMEMLQVYLPARIPSNVDLLCNGAGAIIGAAAGAWLGERWVLSGELRRMRERWFEHGTAVDVCFLLLTLWLVTQLNAEIWLFGNGDVRYLFPEVTGVTYSASSYLLLEGGVAAVNYLGVALMLTAISRSFRAAAASLLLLTLMALGLKSLASAALFIPGNPALWLTPGSMWGLGIGFALWMVLVPFPKPIQVVVATTCLAIGMALVNAAPENPYVSAALSVWQHGHYASMTEMTRTLSSAWSFVAIAYLAYAGYRVR